jgi:hypothetical protein
MKRVALIVVVLAVAAGLTQFAYKQYTRRFSPEAQASFANDGLKVTVDYCQPARKGRLIFGDSAARALVPYGKVWRTGANEATRITINENIVLAGTPLKAGEYSLWTIPGKEDWQVVINRETGQWGTQYDAAQDVFRTKVSSEHVPEIHELFEISFVPQTGGTDMILQWDQTKVNIPIRLE